MRRYFLILMLLAGCVAEPADDDQEEVVLVDEEPGVPEGSYSGGGRLDPCAPIYEVMELDGHEVVIEIPVECHPLDLPYLWWDDDDYHEDITNPVEQELQMPQEQQEQEQY